MPKRLVIIFVCIYIYTLLLQDIADFRQPDRYWTHDTKTRIRKCKHMIVLLEEFSVAATTATDGPTTTRATAAAAGLSQREYERQLVNFVGHLVRLMDDDTFPIRLLTWTQSAVTNGLVERDGVGRTQRNCHSPYLPWSNDHPCNDVLHKLFDSSVFLPRVKLLDNTDLTMPWFGSVEQQEERMRPYILAAMALRIYVIVGEQVALWRKAGQSGQSDGLHRNGIVEPNFELVPYVDWGKPLSPNNPYQTKVND